MTNVWDKPVRLTDLARGPVELHLEPDEATRAQIAKRVGLVGLPHLSADLVVRPWLDGAELTGRFEARVVQLCGVSLEPFEQALRGDIEVRMLPAGSGNIPEDDAPGGEVELDLEAPDPPDILDGETIDVSDYVVEHLALEIDPFPRKPGVSFEFTPPEPEDSPFAVLKQLKDKKS